MPRTTTTTNKKSKPKKHNNNDLAGNKVGYSRYRPAGKSTNHHRYRLPPHGPKTHPLRIVEDETQRWTPEQDAAFEEMRQKVLEEWDNRIKSMQERIAKGEKWKDTTTWQRERRTTKKDPWWKT
jgi:hypothetical protein